MPPKTIPPSIDAKRFTCPHCGAIADQIWFNVYADRTGNSLGTPPALDTAEEVAKARATNPSAMMMQKPSSSNTLKKRSTVPFFSGVVDTAVPTLQSQISSLAAVSAVETSRF
jgi:hypothetical protein